MVALLRQQLEEEEGKFPTSLDDANREDTKEEEETEDMPKQKYFKLVLILSWELPVIYSVLELTLLCDLKYFLAWELQ